MSLRGLPEDGRLRVPRSYSLYHGPLYGSISGARASRLRQRGITNPFLQNLLQMGIPPESEPIPLGPQGLMLPDPSPYLERQFKGGELRSSVSGGGGGGQAGPPNAPPAGPAVANVRTRAEPRPLPPVPRSLAPATRAAPASAASSLAPVNTTSRLVPAYTVSRLRPNAAENRIDSSSLRTGSVAEPARTLAPPVARPAPRQIAGGAVQERLEYREPVPSLPSNVTDQSYRLEYQQAPEPTLSRYEESSIPQLSYYDTQTDIVPEYYGAPELEYYGAPQLEYYDAPQLEYPAESYEKPTDLELEYYDSAQLEYYDSPESAITPYAPPESAITPYEQPTELEQIEYYGNVEKALALREPTSSALTREDSLRPGDAELIRRGLDAAIDPRLLSVGELKDLKKSLVRLKKNKTSRAIETSIQHGGTTPKGLERTIAKLSRALENRKALPAPSPRKRIEAPPASKDSKAIVVRPPSRASKKAAPLAIDAPPSQGGAIVRTSGKRRRAIQSSSDAGKALVVRGDRSVSTKAHRSRVKRSKASTEGSLLAPASRSRFRSPFTYPLPAPVNAASRSQPGFQFRLQ